MKLHKEFRDLSINRDVADKLITLMKHFDQSITMLEQFIDEVGLDRSDEYREARKYIGLSYYYSARALGAPKDDEEYGEGER